MRKPHPARRYGAFALVVTVYASWVAERTGATASTRNRARPALRLPSTPQGARHLWKNKVPKAERLDSLKMHFQRLQSKMAQTQTWKNMKPEAFCAAVEQHIETEFLEKETEEQISGRCHKVLRKLGRAMRLGWEWELLDLEQASSNVSQVELRHVLQRLQSLGPQKQAEYRRIKAGDRHGPASIMRRELGTASDEDFIPSPEEYSTAVASQAMTVWHRQAMALAQQVLKDAKVEHLLDIGTSFNPLRHVFQVTAIDVVPGDDTVLVADFLEVELLDGLKQVQLDADSQRVTAVPTEHFDGALLSMVLRALSRSSASYKWQRREMLRRAARCVRPGGVVVVIERSPLGVMVSAPFQDQFWSLARLRWRKTLRSMRGTNVYILDRLPGKVEEDPAEPLAKMTFRRLQRAW